jgi:hypothetical protein
VNRRAVVIGSWLVGLTAGCPSSPSKPPVAPKDPASGSEDAATQAHLFSELQDDILSSYERDEPLELGTGMIDPRIGAVRIGVGPDDVYITSTGERPPGGAAGHADHLRRWPLELDGATRSEARSKRLEIQIAADQTAAWMADELSWRISMCHRTVVIPLRMTALYAHDGDRWVPVFEHLSFGWPPTPRDGPPPKPIKTAVVSGDLRDTLSGILSRGLFPDPRDPAISRDPSGIAQDPSALVLGPDAGLGPDGSPGSDARLGPEAGDEWHGGQVLQARLPGGRLEDRRVGLVGRDPGAATVAYWVGTYLADVPARPGVAAGKVRMRVTHVFEKRHPAGRAREPSEADSCAPPKEEAKAKDKNADCRWMLVQSHMSQAITDAELTNKVFGTARLALDPLALDCSDGTNPTAPAAEPRPGSALPAAQTP